MKEGLVVSFIGMSNVGKSHWSRKLRGEGLNYWFRRLRKVGFERYCCDDLIEARLGPELKVSGYAGGIKDVARWMGQPYDPQYPETSRKYLEFEGEATREALAAVAQAKPDEKIVIDTTGSVIYLAPDILQELSARTRIVYIKASDRVKEKLYSDYLQNPKPVIWGESFNQKDGETEMEALGRCYPDLLAYRAQRYADLAHITLDYHTLRDPKFTVQDLITVIS